MDEITLSADNGRKTGGFDRFEPGKSLRSGILLRKFILKFTADFVP